MRHVGTLCAAIVIAPLAWILLAFGQERSAGVFANAQGSGALHGGDFLRPLLFLAAAGILVGLLATLRVSPLGALLTGAAYTSSYALLLVAPTSLLNLFRHNVSVAGRHADLVTPIRTGTTMVLGALLLVGIASVGRWRRWPRPEYREDDTAGTRERPLGADGLNLIRSGYDTEPEPTARYSTRPQRDAAGGPHSR
jgi:hypothetical protein